MSITKRNKVFYYSFMVNGKRYQGRCENCLLLDDARAFEKQMKDKIIAMRCITKGEAFAIQYHREITGAAEILIDDAFNMAMQKPDVKRTVSESAIIRKKTAWLDFAAFMKQRFPKIKHLDRITVSHSEAYYGFLQKEGNFIKTASRKNWGRIIQYPKDKQLSPMTINHRLNDINSIFRKLSADLGGMKSPFDSASLKRMEAPESYRDAFTFEELRLIGEKWTPYIKPLFLIACYTALREGDVCTLKWNEVDLDKGIIRRKTRKTGRIVTIPILPPLRFFLLEQQNISGKNEYVLPQHAKDYLGHLRSNLVSRRVKRFLDKIGIVNKKNVSGYGNNVSTKDLHSCRHTFCSLAALYNIPQNIIQSIAGHSSATMTEHYSRHVEIEAMRNRLEIIPDMFSGSKNNPENIPHLLTDGSRKRDKLHAMIEAMEEEKLDQALAFFDDVLHSHVDNFHMGK